MQMWEVDVTSTINGSIDAVASAAVPNTLHYTYIYLQAFHCANGSRWPGISLRAASGGG